MTRHSKNNTASAVFTSAERDRLDYGVQKRRAGKDSFREFDACHLCLHTAKDPVICGEAGHLYCRSCVVDSMLAQMEANKEKQAEYQAWLESRKRQEAGREKEAEEAKVAKFLKDQQGSSLPGLTEPSSKKGKVASYWVPSSATSVDPESIMKEPPSNKILCKADPSKEHNISLKKLLPVVFTLDDNSRPLCPVCRKTLKNGVDMVVLIPCGHVFCVACLKLGDEKEKGGFGSCQLCESNVMKRVVLAKEGTGFAAAGGNVLVTKYDVAFQC